MQELSENTHSATTTGLMSPDFIQVRCPECFKGYNVSLLDVKEAQPRFECVACQTQFWISKAEAVQSQKVSVGHLLRNEVATSQAINNEIFSCPKCSTSYGSGQAECKKCGVVFFKFEDQQKNLEKKRREQVFSASKEVRELWEVVLNDYENIEVHQNFISAAWADACLDYAAVKYGSILEVVPHDEIAQKLAREVQALTGINFEMVATESEESGPAVINKFSFFKGLELSLRKFQWINLIMVCCGFIITMGLFLPHLRNLIGFGSSILFFIVALRYYFRVI